MMPGQTNTLVSISGTPFLSKISDGQEACPVLPISLVSSRPAYLNSIIRGQDFSILKLDHQQYFSIFKPDRQGLSSGQHKFVRSAIQANL